MKSDQVIVGRQLVTVHRLHTVVVGTGAAGLNAADCLYELGVRDIALITENIKSGTSRNTGSDKQTYYKLSCAGNVPDSVEDMASDLMQGGSMHGDHALIEAACSWQGFSKLVQLGVPFPHNRYGEYVGYKTDHDPRARATSAGPLTSKYMTEALEKAVIGKGIRVMENIMVIGVLKDKERCIGLVGLNTEGANSFSERVVLFNCVNVIYATGGPAFMYEDSVYPKSQTGAHGAALAAGVSGVNVTESQYGIASTSFRWNVSGSYQQVIPRYVSTDANGKDPQEFLEDVFDNEKSLLHAVFLKGYQWPFDPKKIGKSGSSLIDLAVYEQIYGKGRRVYMDFTQNPSCAMKGGSFDFSKLSKEAYEYLSRCNGLFGTPVERLIAMNCPAYELYASHGIDLAMQPLPVSVCAQHNNGGLTADMWWQSNLQNFFPIGECAGVFGVYRPGGSALNDTQVSSMRAATYIAAKDKTEPLGNNAFIRTSEEDVMHLWAIASKAIGRRSSHSNVLQKRSEIRKMMSAAGAHVRDFRAVQKAADWLRDELLNFDAYVCVKNASEITEVFRNLDLLTTAYVYMRAIENRIEQGGGSRGSYLVIDDRSSKNCKEDEKTETITLAHARAFAKDDDGRDGGYVQIVHFDRASLKCRFETQQTREIPKPDRWFESVWKEHRSGGIYIHIV